MRASSSFVPTPSVVATRTVSVPVSLNRPPNAPMSPMTSGLFVRRTLSRIRASASSAREMSTPVSTYLRWPLVIAVFRFVVVGWVEFDLVVLRWLVTLLLRELSAQADDCQRGVRCQLQSAYGTGQGCWENGQVNGHSVLLGLWL